VGAPVELSVTPSPAIAEVAIPVEGVSATIEGEKQGPVLSEIRAEHLAPPPVPLASQPATTMSKVESSAHPMFSQAVADAATPVLAPRARRKSGKEKSRRGGQIELFEGHLETDHKPGNPAADARTRASAENSKTPALQLKPSSAASTPGELAESTGHPMNQAAVQPQAEPQAVSAGAENQSDMVTGPPDLLVIEGLAATDGLARTGGNPKLFFKALQHFVEN